MKKEGKYLNVFLSRGFVDIFKSAGKISLILAVSLVLAGCSGKQAPVGESGVEVESIEETAPTAETDSVAETESESAEETESIVETEERYTPWKITQYGPVDANMSYYTIYNEDQGLIIVDGGWVECASHVKNTIKTLGGHVDAWILTHPHADHIGAFTASYPELDGITIDNIYTVDMASPEECLKVASWDNMDAYNDFLALEVEGLQYVKAGDVLDICGLEVEILSTYDADVQSISCDYLNDGSIMFKVYGEEESFLFCADVGVGMSGHLLSKYGEKKLASTYLQMGHHGNGGLSDAFYQTVKPKVAFFDAPDWLMNDETGQYDTPENVELMRAMGSKIYSFNTAPNSVYLK